MHSKHSIIKLKPAAKKPAAKKPTAKKPIHVKLVTPSVLFYSHDFQDKKKQHVKEFLDAKKSAELRNIQTGPLFKGLLLNNNMFDKNGNRAGTTTEYQKFSWGDPKKNYSFGPKGDEMKYLPPFDWIGYGLKVNRTADDPNWLNRTGWWNAYHGVGSPAGDTKPKEKVAGAIIKGGFIVGPRQLHAPDPDIRHPGQTCGNGAYFSPETSNLNGYAGSFTHNGNTYKLGFKVRMNPKTVRIPSNETDYWICNGTGKEVKPTTLLIKKV